MKFTFAPESKPLEGYTIKRAIYRGGFGEVYYAVSDAGREVALKLLQHNTDVELRGVQQCLNLSHPNLVTIFDIRQDGDGDHWIVMEFVAGETLDAAIRRFPSGMPMEEIRRWLPGISEGVTYLHENGLVHRDLKPANIFSDSGCVKVGDVGLSKFITQSRRSAQTQSVGTVYYMAPEVAKGRYGKEVDVYALGVIVYEMLTGKVPFDGDSTGEILMKHLTEKPDLTKLPPRLRDVVGRSLEKDPARRFTSPREFASAIDAAVVGRDFPGAKYRAFEETSDHSDGSSQSEFRRASRAARGSRAKFTPWPTEEGQEYGSAAFTWVCLLIFFSWMNIGVMVPISAMFIVFFGGNWLYRKVSGITSSVGQSVSSFTQGFSADFLRGFRCKDYPAKAMRARDSVLQARQAAVNAARAVVASVDHGVPPMRAAALDAVRGAKATVSNVVFPTSLSQSAAPALTRWTHWTGAAAMSSIVVVLMSLTAAIITDRYTGRPLFHITESSTPDAWAGFAAFVLPAIAACWGIMAACKYWEGRGGSGFARRASLFVTGLVVGAFSGETTRFLSLGNVPSDTPFSGVLQGSLFPVWTRKFHLPNVFRELETQVHGFDPNLVGWMLVFATFFALRNWSRQTDEARPSRFRLRSLIATAFVAWLTMSFLGVRSDAFLIWAAIVSAGVQISSVWRPAASAPAARKTA